MSNELIILFLSKKKKKWFSTKQIAHGLKLNLSGVTRTLAKMRHYNEVFYKQTGHNYYYQYR